ncbi:MAG: DUF7507 domain-containing protein [Candidatus Heimdallarchaeaceae archaeon]
MKNFKNYKLKNITISLVFILILFVAVIILNVDFSLAAVSICSPGSITILDEVDIGDPTSEALHSITGWSTKNIHGGYGGCQDGVVCTYRQVLGEGAECAEDKRDATVVLHAGKDNTVSNLRIKHLDGASAGLDSFEVYIGTTSVGVFNDFTTTSKEIWVETEFDVSSYNFTGDLTVRLHATDAFWPSCNTYGQVSIDWIKLNGHEACCGDEICDSEESCSTCAEDCGTCWSICSETCDEDTLSFNVEVGLDYYVDNPVVGCGSGINYPFWSLVFFGNSETYWSSDIISKNVLTHTFYETLPAGNYNSIRFVCHNTANGLGTKAGGGVLVEENVPGEGIQTETCLESQCPTAIDGGWTEWSTCSETCGGGTQTRTCTNPEPQYGGADCVGDNQGDCNEWDCTGSCPTSCGYEGGTIPDGHGDILTCDATNPCPIDGGWTEWSTCSETCSGGTQTRTCINPEPQYGGADCEGELIQECNTQACSSGGGGGGGAVMTYYAPKLTIEKSVTEEFANPGSTINYSIVVKNTGSAVAYNIILTDTLLDGFTYTDTGLSTREWDLGTLGAGAEETRTYQVDVGEDVEEGDYLNTAEVKSDSLASVLDEATIEIKEGEVLGVATTTVPTVLPKTGASSSVLFILFGSLTGLVLGTVELKKTLILKR